MSPRRKTAPPTQKHPRSSSSGRKELIAKEKDEKQSVRKKTVLDNRFHRTALTVGGVVIAKIRSIYFAPNMPTLQDFSGRWWITIGATPGHMTIKQLKDRRLEGAFSLENGLSGRIRGRHDGYSFYNLVLTDDREMKVFVESAMAQLIGDCLVVAAVPADLTERQRNSIVRFSARGCDE